MESSRAGHSWPLPASAVDSPACLDPVPGQESPDDFALDVGVMWDLFTFAMTGTATEEIGLAAGRYRMVLAGGQPITVHTEARGASERGGSCQSRHIAATRSGGVKAP
jgi:hypothetical protein